MGNLHHLSRGGFVMRRPAFYFSLLLFPFYAHAQPSDPVRAIMEGDVVNAATNAAIANARVRVSTAQAILYGKVDRQGHFTIGNLSPGSYQLTVDSPGFVQSRSEEHTSELQSLRHL